MAPHPKRKPQSQTKMPSNKTSMASSKGSKSKGTAVSERQSGEVVTPSPSYVHEGPFASPKRGRGRPRKDRSGDALSLPSKNKGLAAPPVKTSKPREQSSSGSGGRQHSRSNERDDSQEQGLDMTSEATSDEENQSRDDSGSERANSGKLKVVRKDGNKAPSIPRDFQKYIHKDTVMRIKRKITKQSSLRGKEDLGDSDSGSEEEDDEHQRRWGPEHEARLDETKAQEIGLWKKALTLHGVSPLDLLPPHIPMETIIANGRAGLDDEEIGLAAMNWSQDTCLLFGQVISCPIFKDNLDYLHHVLAYALYLRVGETEAFPKPDVSGKGLKGRSLPFIQAIRRGLRGMVEEDVLLLTLESAEVDDRPLHFDFLLVLKEVVKPSPDRTRKKALSRADFDNIIKAWNIYAVEVYNGLDLFEMKNYADAWSRKYSKTSDKPAPGYKPSSARVLHLKKKYIISGWRRATRRKGKSVARVQRTKPTKSMEPLSEQRQGSIDLDDLVGDELWEDAPSPKASSTMTGRRPTRPSMVDNLSEEYSLAMDNTREPLPSRFAHLPSRKGESSRKRSIPETVVSESPRAVKRPKTVTNTGDLTRSGVTINPPRVLPTWGRDWNTPNKPPY